MPRLSPPRLARWLLERLLPKNVRGESIRGDLLEEFGARAERTAIREARRWYWAESLKIGANALSDRLRTPHDRSPERASLMDSLRLDLKFAVRGLLKARGFTITAVITLALGIGASTAVFSVVNAVQLRPLPFPDPDRLMWLTETNKDGRVISLAWPDFVDWRDRSTSFEELAGIRRGLANFTDNGEPERLDARAVTSNFLRILGVQPALGRMFTAEEDRVGAPRVVLISDRLWRRRFGADPSVLGRKIVLEGNPHEIIGVLPAQFRYNLQTDDDILWSLGRQATPDTGLTDRGNHNGLSAIGRLRSGVSEAKARTELEGISASLTEAYPRSNAATRAHIEPLAQRLVGEITPMLQTLLGAVAVLLLLATVNVANLLVTRSVSQRHELSVRAALGCGRWRMLRQLLVESVVLALAGGLAGVALSFGLVKLFLVTAPADVPRLGSIGMDSAVWLFAFSVSLLAALILGVLPGLQSSGIDGQQALVRTGRGNTSTASAHRVRRTLMVVEVALAIILVTGAGLMTRTMYALAFQHIGILSLEFHVDKLSRPLL